MSKESLDTSNGNIIQDQTLQNGNEEVNIPSLIE